MAPLLRSLAALPGPLLFVACGYGDPEPSNRYEGEGYVTDGSCGEAESTAIDTGEILEVEAGAGAGAFIEYEAGGTYRVTTTCDTSTYGDDCRWDIVVTLLDGAPLESMSPVGLEDQDTLLFGDDTSVRFVVHTDTDFDGFSLQTEPGAAIRFDALLDGGCANRYIFWVGDGALHSGAPSSVLELVPSEP